MTLEELLKNQDNTDLKSSITTIAKFLEQQEQDKLATFTDIVKQLGETQKKIADTLQKILDRPDPEFPEQKETTFPETQKIAGEVSMTKPDWWKDADPQINNAPEIIKALGIFFDRLGRKISDENENTRELLSMVLDKEPEAVTKEPAPMQIGSIRRHSRWQVASTRNGKLIGTVDGVNATFYLPSQPQKDSESIRLAQGSPLSGGEDYTLTGNKILFTLPPVSNSPIEVRYQT